ncbi:MAG: AAA family ATPase [Bacillota bacterium]
MGTKPFVAIAISRLLGAGGATLGQRLAKRLGYAYLDRAILQRVADQIGINDADLSRWDEHVCRFWERLADVFALGPPDAIYSTPPPASTRIQDQQLFQLESRVIREAAFQRNVVVIGRGGFWVLRDHPGLVSVFLHAPPWTRIAAVMRTYKLRDEREAKEMIDRVDDDRRRFIQTMTGQTPGDGRCYHLCIDTHRAGLDLAEEMVVSLVARVQEQIGMAGG